MSVNVCTQLFGQVFAKLATEDAVEYFFKDGPGLPPTSGNPFWSTLSSSSTICRHRMSLQIVGTLKNMDNLLAAGTLTSFACAMVMDMLKIVVILKA